MTEYYTQYKRSVSLYKMDDKYLDVYIKIHHCLNNIFKDVKKYEEREIYNSKKYMSHIYGQTRRSILVRDHYRNNIIRIHYFLVYKELVRMLEVYMNSSLITEDEYKTYSYYNNCMSIIHSHLVNYMKLKGRCITYFSY